MKASEINVGDVVAITEGVGRLDRQTQWATKAEVLSEPDGGYVRLRLLEKPRTALGRRSWGAAKPYKKGDTLRVKTAWLWVPWPEIAEITFNRIVAEQRREKAEAEREKRREALQRRIDAIVGSEGGSLHFARGSVYIGIEDLEKILDAAERKRQ